MTFRFLVLAAAIQPASAATTAAAPTDTDLAEFQAGNVTRYSTRGHAKAAGIDLSIAYPNTWSSEDPGTGATVRRFSRQSGAATYSFSIDVAAANPAYADASAGKDRAFYKSKEWAEAAAPLPSVILVRAPTSFEGLPAGLIEYSRPITHPGGRPIHGRHWGIEFLYDGRLVRLTASMTVPESLGSEVESRFDAARPLFGKMFESAVLHNVAGAPTTGTPFTRFPQLEEQLSRTNAPRDESRMRSSDMGVLWVVLSLLVVGALGMVPALVIRFVILRRPMTKQQAVGWSVAFSLLVTIASLGARIGFDLSRTIYVSTADIYLLLGIVIITQITLTFGRAPRIELGPPPELSPQPGAQAYPAATPLPVAAPAYGAPPYGAPQYPPSQYAAPQYGVPQYGSLPYGLPQYAAPADHSRQASAAPQAQNTAQTFGTSPAYGAPPNYDAPTGYGMHPAYTTPPVALTPPYPMAGPPQPALPQHPAMANRPPTAGAPTVAGGPPPAAPLQPPALPKKPTKPPGAT
jgi:hypothetical protein